MDPTVAARLDGICRERGYATMHDMEFVAANAFLLFFLALGISHISIGILDATSKGFRALDDYHKRNCVSYILEIIGCSMVLGLQIIHGWDLIFYNEDLTNDQRLGLCWAALYMCTLYTYELVYRLRTHWQLAVHHLVSIFIMLLCFFNWNDYPKEYKGVVRMCLIFVCHASMEQLCFIALFAHRILPHDKYGSLLRSLHFWAAITSYTVKTSVFFITWVLWLPVAFPKQDNSYTWFWKYVFPILNILLLFVQWWASNVFYVLSRRFIHSAKDVAMFERLTMPQTAYYYTADVNLHRRKVSEGLHKMWKQGGRKVSKSRRESSGASASKPNRTRSAKSYHQTL